LLAVYHLARGFHLGIILELWACVFSKHPESEKSAQIEKGGGGFPSVL
jgi:hypothetical protein